MPPLGSTLGLVGAGAFGAFALPHLTRHFAVTVCDAADVSALAHRWQAEAGTLAEAAACEVVMLAVPVQRMEGVLRELAPRLRPGTLVVDVASVKLKPVETMARLLPPEVAIVGTHPLFGPQSGRNGIAGLKVAVCEVRGGRGPCVARFLREALDLQVIETSAEDHDRQLAYVQGLTHLLAKVVVALDLPAFALTTTTYELMQQMVGMVRYDSDELFKAIERENPFTAEAKRAFFAAAKALQERLEGEG